MALSKVSLKYQPADVRLSVVLEDYKRAINKLIDDSNASSGGSSSGIFNQLDPNYFAKADKIYITHSYSAGTGLTGGGSLGANRTFSLSHLGIESLADPSADRIFCWDNSAGVSAWLSLGSGVSIDATPSLQVDHDGITNFAANEHFLQTDIAYVSTALSTGLLKVTTGTGALSVVTDNSSNWDTAYGWGNHALAGYLTSVTAHDLLSATHGDTTASGVSRGSIIIGDANPKWIELTVGGAGTVLTSDGTDVSWQAGGGGAHAILSATHSDSAVSAVARGSLIYGNATPAWDDLTVGAAGTVLTANGTDVAWAEDISLGGYLYCDGTIRVDAQAPDEAAYLRIDAADECWIYLQRSNVQIWKLGTPSFETGRNTDFSIFDADNNEVVCIDQDGLVGINTTAQSQLLHIKSGTFEIENSGADLSEGVLMYFAYPGLPDNYRHKITSSVSANAGQNFLRWYLCDTTAAGFKLLMGIKDGTPPQLKVEGALTLLEGTAPANVATYGNIYVKSSDSLLYFQTDGGVEYGLTTGGTGGVSPAPKLFQGPGTKRWGLVAAQASAVSTNGFLVTTATGTASASEDDYGTWRNLRCTGTTTPGGLRGTYTSFRRSRSPNIWIRIQTDSDISSQRLFITIANAIYTTWGDDPIGGAIRAGFRYSTAAANANWWFITKDGATQNETDTGVACTASTIYDFTISMPTGAAIAWSVTPWGGATTSGSTSTNIPGNSDDMGIQFVILATSAVNRSYNFGYCYAEAIP